MSIYFIGSYRIIFLINLKHKTRRISALFFRNSGFFRFISGEKNTWTHMPSFSQRWMASIMHIRVFRYQPYLSSCSYLIVIQV